jgi:hypothetical protein
MARKKTPARSTASPRSPSENRSPYVQIAGTLGGTLIGMLAIIGIFASNSAAVAMPLVAGAVMILGIFLGYFASKK